MKLFGRKKEQPTQGPSAMESGVSIPDRRDGTRFIEGQIRNELSSIIEDILLVYKFNDNSVGLGNVFPYSEDNLKANTLNLHDISLGSYMGNIQVISKVHLKNKYTGVDFFVDTKPDENNQVNMGDVFGLVTPTDIVTILNIFDESIIDALRDAFGKIWNTLEDGHRLDAVDQIIVFKIAGFSALYTEPKSQVEATIADDNAAAMMKHYGGVLKANYGMIDAQDSISTIGGSTNLAAATSMRLKIDDSYAQIAMYLKIPITRLLGRPPEGMNATGESDDTNYQQTLDRFRIGYLEPFLNEMKIKYSKIDKFDIVRMEKILQMHAMAGINPSPLLIEKLRIMGDTL